MKTFLAVLLAALAGTVAAWTIVESRYGGQQVYFGVMDLEGNVTAQDVPTLVNLGESEEVAKIELPGGNEHDFGVMRPDERGEHRFRIRNAGALPLNLRLGKTTCKCTLGDLDNNQLAPGEETTVKLEWKVETPADTFSQSAELMSNDPENPIVQLVIQGQVIRGLEIVPRAWTFGDIAAGEPITIKGTVYNHLDSDIRPDEPSFSTRFMRERGVIEVEPFTPGEADGVHASARQGFRVTATVPPGIPQGSVEGNFLFRYRRLNEDGEDQGDAETVGASLSGRIVGVLGMIPHANLKEVKEGTYLLDLGRVAADEGHQSRAMVMVKGRQRDQIRLKIGEVHPPGVFELTLGEPTIRATTALYRLDIRLLEDRPAVALAGNINDEIGWVMIEADDADIPPMRLLIKVEQD